jgi:predicted O-linked N-acetylglucosamine transferase (SPINDLY family)
MIDPIRSARDALSRGHFAEALRIAEAHVAARPFDVQAARLYATLCSELENTDAERAWRNVIALDAEDVEAHYMLGNLEGERGNYEKAVEHFRAALVRAPTHPQLRASLGLALDELGQVHEAEASFRQALNGVAEPPHALLAALARNLFRQRRFAEALHYFDILAQKSAITDATLNAAYAACLSSEGRDEEADTNFRRAIDQTSTDRPGLVREYAAFLMRGGRYADAMRILEEARVDSCVDLLAASMLLICRMQLADWRDYDALRINIIERVAQGLSQPDDIVPAYDFLALCDDALLQRKVAERWANVDAPYIGARPPPQKRKGEKLRLGFVSSDYNNHPVGRLVVGLFERLDRQRFEVFAYATSAATTDRFDARINASVDRYRSLDRRDPDVGARAVASDAIDVLFDLNGFSGGEAIRIFARRPAPVQINFLGYTGTLGSPAYDFILTDRYCVPPEQRDAFEEQLLYVEPCYLPSDPTRSRSPQVPIRADYALPEAAFVFCAFAAVYKMTPQLFDSWIRLLRDVPGSVLWLRHLPADRVERMRSAAARHDIDGRRLISAPSEDIDRYLARFALADVLLDSAPFGSHTTVNDALFSGLPVVTIAGESFAARASASQVRAVGLSNLIAHTPDEYVEIARSLAMNTALLDTTRRALADARKRSSLFDIDAYARAFEAAVAHAYERSTSGMLNERA